MKGRRGRSGTAREEMTAVVQAGQEGSWMGGGLGRVQSGQTLDPAGSAKRSDVGCKRQKRSRRGDSSPISETVFLAVSPVHGTELISISSHAKRLPSQPQVPLHTRLVVFLFQACQKASSGDQ